MQLTKDILRTTDAYITKLARWWIHTVEDMLWCFPKEIEDRSDVLDHFAYVDVKQKNSIRVKVVNIKQETTRYKKKITKMVVSDISGQLCECVFFRAPWVLSQTKIGSEIIVTGKPKYEYGKLSFPQPEFEPFTPDRNVLIPVYSDIQWVGAKWIGNKMPLLYKYLDRISDVLPDEIIQKKSFSHRAKNISWLHIPISKSDFERCKQELAYEELWIIQYEAFQRKITIQDTSSGHASEIPLDTEQIKSWLQDVGFTLTDHQKIALFEILKDMEQDYCMQRLLQWDVGTGKTIVAFLAALHAIKQWGIQVAYMAPTAILASQIFAGAQEFFSRYDLEVSFLIGSIKVSEKKSIKARLASWNTNIIIGTHALIQEDVLFADLGLVIIDEQHRFGVQQRKKLTQISASGRYPHELMMTATPIPRTLSMTMYGDQDLSIIREYPKWRLPILTTILSKNNRAESYRFITSQIEKKRQVYWISPLVEESEKLGTANVHETTEKLRQIFPKCTIDMIHGKMKQEEKDRIMEDFNSGAIDILSATSVIEVGVNNPNATIMCIEDAYRFWLSQLHQFRWRVGRWVHQSYCYLFSDNTNTKRLRAMERTNDGFELSEIDLELRGPGEVYGVRQSGIPDLKLAKLTDINLVYEVRKDIEEYLEAIR